MACTVVTAVEGIGRGGGQHYVRNNKEDWIQGVSVGSGTVINATKLVSGSSVDVPYLTSVLLEQVPGGWRDFPFPSRSAMWPTHPPIQWVPSHLPGGKAVGSWR